ncbi:MAG: winged helix-turn-helix domain-containing protein [Coriobacteriales bacterium]|jgi:DNA-binding response OmpR family regulator|nr:winged helix-turn-helix domain-containing protein [Coriobacteriales bacterium]
MHRRSVLVATRQPELAHKLNAIFAGMDAEARFVNATALDALKEVAPEDLDLVIIEAGQANGEDVEKIEELLSAEGSVSLLLVVAPESLAATRLPRRLSYDFVMRQALDIEFQVRIHQLLWPGEEAGSADFIRVGNLTLNLATYQIKVDGQTLDLTYLEYALLAFLITHPGRTYSRDALLRRVWGFDYYGGSRTVDVHVRRVRSKLGPELAQRLETVRGVGYLWNS